MVSAAGVETLDFGERQALFNESRQALIELNPTALLIWRGLTEGDLPAAVAESLVKHGAAGPAAAGYVEDALHRWLGDGWLVPAEVNTQLHGPADIRAALSILDVGFVVEVFGATPPGLLEFLEPLGGNGAIDRRLIVVAWRDCYFLFSGAASRGLYASDELVPAVKALLTELLAASVDDGFLAHGGLVEFAGRRLFLSGGPGAGKSTLSLALRKSGFDCLSDDIVHVDDSGQMKGAPFAPCLKSGSWPLLADQGLDGLPVHRRADGQQVRYLPAAISPGQARPLDAFIALHRTEDGPTHLAPLSSLDAMQTLLDGAFASAGRISAAQVSGLAEAFRATRCFALHYVDLAGAAAPLCDLARE